MRARELHQRQRLCLATLRPLPCIGAKGGPYFPELPVKKRTTFHQRHIKGPSTIIERSVNTTEDPVTDAVHRASMQVTLADLAGIQCRILGGRLGRAGRDAQADVGD